MDEDALLDALRTVDDPEAGMNIVDLGLVYGVEATPPTATVRMTMTSPACPLGDYLSDAVRGALELDRSREQRQPRRRNASSRFSLAERRRIRV